MRRLGGVRPAPCVVRHVSDLRGPGYSCGLQSFDVVGQVQSESTHRTLFVRRRRYLFISVGRRRCSETPAIRRVNLPYCFGVNRHPRHIKCSFVKIRPGTHAAGKVRSRYQKVYTIKKCQQIGFGFNASAQTELISQSLTLEYWDYTAQAIQESCSGHDESIII